MMDILFQAPFAVKVDWTNSLTHLVAVTVVGIYFKDVTAA